MASGPNHWKVQDAKARFSELVRRAREAGPQTVTHHGRPVAVVVDPETHDVRPRPRTKDTLAEFVRASRLVFIADGLDDAEAAFERRLGTSVDPRRVFDE